MRKVFVCTLALALLSALPSFAVSTIESGIDVWYTAGDGTTFVDFAKMPIPKGFFCAKSEAFTGRLVLRGRPLATGIPGELGGADTIVQRLDNAAFTKSGEAVTRIQIRALQLESVAPVKTACGDFHVRVSLNGQQPVTRMRIIKDTEVSGRFVAPIRVNFKLTFLPANGLASRKLELAHNFHLLPAKNAEWTAIRYKRASSRAASVLVDTDGDQIPETYLPKTSGNFMADLPAERARQLALGGRLAKNLEPTEDTCDSSRTIDYGGDYGSHGCHMGGADPDCHPHTEATGVHCSQPCPPCGATYEDLP